MTRNKFPVKRRKKPGPKRIFTEEFLRQLEMLAMMGATDKQLALFFDKPIGTIEQWLKDDPLFREVRKRGGMVADMKVAESLYKRAIGHTYTETEYNVYVDKDSGEEIQTPRKRVRKYIVPDVTAQIFWLKNRQREHWADVNKIQHGGTVNHYHQKIEDVPVEDLSEESQEVLFEITQKQLTNGAEQSGNN